MSSLPVSKRKENTRELNIKILIVCEGERTEPNYFHGFRLPGKNIVIVGSGMNTDSLVNYAIRLKIKEFFSETWCVFDHDSFPQTNIANAFDLMRIKSINAAYSNEAFELWYLLHFCYLDARISRHDYCDRLSDHLGIKYQKNQKDIYSILLAKQNVALRNARRLYDLMTEDGVLIQNASPITTVFKLVDRLNELVQERNKTLEAS
jgi:hypothetical protein